MQVDEITTNIKTLSLEVPFEQNFLWFDDVSVKIEAYLSSPDEL